jgi:hypothetical protein
MTVPSGSVVHLAVDTLCYLLALHVTAADVGDREAVARLSAELQDVTGDAVSVAYVDQGYTRETVTKAAAVVLLLTERKVPVCTTAAINHEISERGILKFAANLRIEIGSQCAVEVR